MKNEYKITKKLMKSWANEYHIYGKRNVINFALWCIVGVCGIFMLTIYFFYDNNWLNLYFAFVFLFLSIYKLFFSRFVVLSRRYKLFEKTYGVSEWLRTTEFLDDKIVVTDHTSVMEMKYSQITKSKERSNVVLMFCNNNTAIRVYKDAFVEGSWEECKELINSKCSN